MEGKFPNKIIDEAWLRASGHCETCNKLLVKKNRGRNSGKRGCWEAHHIDRSKSSVLSNCKILCIDCHKKTKSFGKPKSR